MVLPKHAETLGYNLGQNKVRNKTTPPLAQKPKRAIFPGIEMGGGRGGLNFSFQFSKTVAGENELHSWSLPI